MKNIKAQFIKLVWNSWIQKSQSISDHEAIHEKPEDDKADHATLHIAFIEEAKKHIKETRINLRNQGIANANKTMLDAYVFSPQEFWRLLILFRKMTEQERKEFFEEYELRITKEPLN